jgi:C1A family cysteine protease
MKALLFVSAALAFQMAQAELIDVQRLNQHLEKSNAGWVAKKNHLTGLSKKEARAVMGLRENVGQGVEFLGPQTELREQLPSAIDWRNKDGQNWVSPIADQGNCGSCVAFASVGVLETQYKISSLLPSFNIKLSPQHLFACGGGGCGFGWTPSSATRFIQQNGVPDEACLPYTSGATGDDVACRASCPDASQRSVKIYGYRNPTRGTTDVMSVKQALQSGPVVTTLSVYSDFMAYAGGVYKHVSGEYLGGHAISIIGYDDTKGAYIIRNSWGLEWGENGFGYVAYSDISGVGVSTWLYQMPAMAGGVSVESPADYAYFTGQATLKATSTYSSTDSISVGIYDAKNEAVMTANCAGSSCDQNLDVSNLPDGRYEVQMIANNNRGEHIGTSARHFFYVVNQQPELLLTFGGKGTDLDSDLHGRIEMKIQATSSSVPMSSIEFHRRGPDGKEEVRTADVVPSKLTMGWRTNLVPNGDYEIWFVGRLKSNGMNAVVESARRNVHVKN